MKLQKQFKPELSSRTSKAFNQAASMIKQDVDKSLKARDPKFLGIDITEMRNGSIIVDFIAVFSNSMITTPSKLNETLSSLVTSGAIQDADPNSQVQVQGKGLLQCTEF